MRKLFLFCLSLLPGAMLPAQTAQDILFQYLTDMAINEIERQFFSPAPDSVAAGPIIDPGWDDYYHTADEPGEQGTGYDSFRFRPQGVRIGAICMDGTHSDQTGRGACSGFGGVRYWIYQVNEDSTYQHPTTRHWQHPDPLSEEEVMNLASRQPRKDKPFGGGRGGGFDIEALLATMMVCLTIAYLGKLWFER